MCVFAEENQIDVNINSCEFFWDTLANYPLCNDKYKVGDGALYVGLRDEYVPYDIFVLDDYKSPKMKNGYTNHFIYNGTNYIYGITFQSNDIIQISIIDNIVNETMIERDIPSSETDVAIYQNGLCTVARIDELNFSLWCRGYRKAKICFSEPVRWLDLSTVVTDDGDIYKILYSNAPWAMKPVLIATDTENAVVNAGNVMFEKNEKEYIMLLVGNKEVSSAFSLPKYGERGLDLEKIDLEFVPREIKR
jgi:hypothetical protein